MTNKKTGPLYIAYTTETDTHKKLKLLNELSKNNIAYQYDKCVVNHCKKIFKDLMKLLRTFISVIPHTNPKREKIDNLATPVGVCASLGIYVCVYIYISLIVLHVHFI